MSYYNGRIYIELSGPDRNYVEKCHKKLSKMVESATGKMVHSAEGHHTNTCFYTAYYPIREHEFWESPRIPDIHELERKQNIT